MLLFDSRPCYDLANYLLTPSPSSSSSQGTPSGYDASHRLTTTRFLTFRNCIDGEMLLNNQVTPSQIPSQIPSQKLVKSNRAHSNLTALKYHNHHLHHHQCVPCPSGSYSLHYGTPCTPCPEGTDSCTGGTIVASPGYWRINTLATIFLSCPLPEACVGGSGVVKKSNSTSRTDDGYRRRRLVGSKTVDGMSEEEDEEDEDLADTMDGVTDGTDIDTADTSTIGTTITTLFSYPTAQTSTSTSTSAVVRARALKAVSITSRAFCAKGYRGPLCAVCAQGYYLRYVI